MAFGWLTVAVVRETLGLRPGDAVDDVAMGRAAAAAETYVEGVRREYQVLTTTTDPVTGEETVEVTGYEPDAAIILGAAMLANRWYARRGSPLGVVGYAELGTSGILRYDPDVARLLRLGNAGAFVFGAPTTSTVS